MPKKRVKIPEQDTIDLILKRLAGKTLEEIAEEYGVSKQVVQYHEKKESTQELKKVLLTRAAEVAGEALGQRALMTNSIEIPNAAESIEESNKQLAEQADDLDEDKLSDLILATGARPTDQRKRENGNLLLGGDTDLRRPSLMESKA